MLYISIKKRKTTVLSLPRVLFTLDLTFALQSRHLTLVFFNHHGQNSNFPNSMGPGPISKKRCESPDNFYEFMTLLN